MLTTHDVARYMIPYSSISGINEMVKIDIKISRKNVLLLTFGDGGKRQACRPCYSGCKPFDGYTKHEKDFCNDYKRKVS
jgi:hypothetical protein